MSKPAPARRTSSGTYHGCKKALLGNTGPAPAWKQNNNAQTAKANGAGPSNPPAGAGSKILLSNLPLDVGKEDVEDLFKRTVGPTKDVLMVYDKNGWAKGVAVVTFKRKTDAALARTKYNGKTIDQSAKIRIEIIVDSDSALSGATGAPGGSLLARLGGAAPAPAPRNPLMSVAPQPGSNGKPHAKPKAKANAKAPVVAASKRRVKKGPKRVAKKTAEQLDQDMEDYRATVEIPPARA